MRVLHVGKFFPPFAGGMENYLGDLVLAQRRAGDEPWVIAHHHERGLATVLQEWQDIPVRRVRILGRASYVPIAPTFGWHLRRMIKKVQPDVLHFHLPNVAPFGALLSRAARKAKWVAHWHADVVASDIDTTFRWTYPAYRPWESWLLARCAAVIATSEPYLATSDPLKRWRDKAHVVPLGVDARRLPEPTDDLRDWAQSQWGDGAMRLLMVGRMTYYKGHDRLLDAVAELDGVKLLLVGGGPLENRLRRRIDAADLGDRVVMTGRLDDAKTFALMATCDAFCLPSLERTEAFGLVLVEAMRHGKPAIVSAIPGSGTGFVVQDGETGLTVPPGKVDALRQAIETLRDAPSKRKTMADAARQRFTTTFDIDQAARGVRQVYDLIMR